MSGRSPSTRRRFLYLAGASAAGLAGCSGGGGGGGGGGDGGDGGQQSAEDLGPVPDAYATATSLDGTERDPDSLQPKKALQYQSRPANGQRCSDCRYYIEDKNGDGLGACAIVRGKIEPDGWCASFAPYTG